LLRVSESVTLSPRQHIPPTEIGPPYPVSNSTRCLNHTLQRRGRRIPRPDYLRPCRLKRPPPRISRCRRYPPPGCRLRPSTCPRNRSRLTPRSLPKHPPYLRCSPRRSRQSGMPPALFATPDSSTLVSAQDRPRCGQCQTPAASSPQHRSQTAPVSPPAQTQHPARKPAPRQSRAPDCQTPAPACTP